MKNYMKLIAASCCALTLAGCITNTPFKHKNTYVPPTRATTIHTVPNDTLESVLIRQTAKYSVTRLKIPANDTAPTTIVDYYRSKHEGVRNLIVMSPSLGTRDPGLRPKYEWPFLNYFAKKGWDAALIYRADIKQPKDLLTNLEKEVELSVAGYRHAITHLLMNPEVDKDHLCAIGISMGGIITSVAVAQDNRIKYTILALTGSTDIVLENVDENNPEAFVRDIVKNMQMYGGREQFIQEFKKRVTMQPQTYAHLLDAHDTMLFIAKRDKVIPRPAAEDFRAKAGFPQTKYIHVFGHVGTFFLYPIIRAEALDFFKNHIEEDKQAARVTEKEGTHSVVPSSATVATNPPNL